MKLLRLLRVGIWLLIGCPSQLASSAPNPDAWHSDFRQAIETARGTGKDNLLIFTGLAWEPWSRKLRDETFMKAAFCGELGKDFVLTLIDLPEMPKDTEKLNELEIYQYGLARGFKLNVFPSLYLCTSDGHPYGLVGYVEGGPEFVVRAIRAKKDAYAAMMGKIVGLHGPARALAIEAWLKTLPEPLQALHQDKMEMIVESDPKNETGLWFKYKMALLLPKARQLRYAGRLDQAEPLYLAIIQDVKPEGEQLQDTHYELADLYFQRKDYDNLLKALDHAIEAAPSSPRMTVLNEMMEVFTRQWIYTKYKPDQMKAVAYDYKRIGLSPDDAGILLKLIGEAKTVVPKSTRNKVLEKMISEVSNYPD